MLLRPNKTRDTNSTTLTFVEFFNKKAFKEFYENSRVGAIGFGTERYSRGTEHRRGLVAEPTPLVSAAGARHVVAAWQEETRVTLNLPPPQISAQPGL